MKKPKKSKTATKQKKISAAEFERKFDAGEDITPWLDLKRVRRLYPSSSSPTIHIPQQILKSIDREAVRRGVTRQTLVNTLLSEGLENSSP